MLRLFHQSLVFWQKTCCCFLGGFLPSKFGIGSVARHLAETRCAFVVSASERAPPVAGRKRFAPKQKALDFDHFPLLFDAARGDV